MEAMNYTRIHQAAGINNEILTHHPGGAIVEIGGGTRNRFANALHCPPVINIDLDEDAYGDVVVPVDINTLEEGLHDLRVAPAIDHFEGAGSVIMSHSLYEKRPEV